MEEFFRMRLLRRSRRSLLAMTRSGMVALSNGKAAPRNDEGGAVTRNEGRAAL